MTFDDDFPSLKPDMEISNNWIHKNNIAKYCIDKQKVKDAILNLKNPYPKDIFLWGNKEKSDLTKGRLNEFFYRIVENTKEDLLKELFGDEK